MDASRKKTILIVIASCAGLLLLAALGLFLYRPKLPEYEALNEALVSRAEANH
jgi:hypothetical protein